MHFYDSIDSASGQDLILSESRQGMPWPTRPTRDQCNVARSRLQIARNDIEHNGYRA